MSYTFKEQCASQSDQHLLRDSSSDLDYYWHGGDGMGPGKRVTGEDQHLAPYNHRGDEKTQSFMQ